MLRARSYRLCKDDPTANPNPARKLTADAHAPYAAPLRCGNRAGRTLRTSLVGAVRRAARLRHGGGAAASQSRFGSLPRRRPAFDGMACGGTSPYPGDRSPHGADRIRPATGRAADAPGRSFRRNGTPQGMARPRRRGMAAIGGQNNPLHRHRRPFAGGRAAGLPHPAARIFGSRAGLPQPDDPAGVCRIGMGERPQPSGTRHHPRIRHRPACGTPPCGGCGADRTARPQPRHPGPVSGDGGRREAGADPRTARSLRTQRHVASAGRLGTARGDCLSCREPAAAVAESAAGRPPVAQHRGRGADLALCRHGGPIAERRPRGAHVHGPAIRPGLGSGLSLREHPVRHRLRDAAHRPRPAVRPEFPTLLHGRGSDHRLGRAARPLRSDPLPAAQRPHGAAGGGSDSGRGDGAADRAYVRDGSARGAAAQPGGHPARLCGRARGGLLDGGSRRLRRAAGGFSARNGSRGAERSGPLGGGAAGGAVEWQAPKAAMWVAYLLFIAVTLMLWSAEREKTVPLSR